MLEPDRNSFGVLRLAMAIAVLVSHSFYLASGQTEAEPLYAWTGYTLGQHGVQVFFVLSGLLVTQSLMKSGSVLDYGLARALRIFPALIVCVGVTAFVLGPLATVLNLRGYFADPGLFAYLLKTVFLVTGSAPLPGLFDTHPLPGIVNSSLWTLKYEVLCYIGLAVLGSLAIRTGLSREIGVAIAGFAVGAILVARPELATSNTPTGTIYYFAVFFGAGVLAYAMRCVLPVTLLILAPLAVLMVAAIGTHWSEVTMALALGYGAIWAASFKMGPLRAFTNEQDYSYGVYIYGVPATQLLIQFVPGLAVGPLILLTIAIVLPLALLSWELIERPMLRRRYDLVAGVNRWLGWAMHSAPSQVLESVAHPLVEAQSSDTAQPPMPRTAGTATRLLTRLNLVKPEPVEEPPPPPPPAHRIAFVAQPKGEIGSLRHAKPHVRRAIELPPAMLRPSTAVVALAGQEVAAGLSA